MKRRIIALVLAVILILSLGCMLAGCGKKGECEACGKTAKLKKLTVAGETAYLCDDCYKLAKALSSMF